MSVARLFAANGLQLGQSYELDAIAAVILGGTSFVGGIGTIWGTLIGALIIAVLSNGLILLGVSDIWQYIIKGLVIIGAVTLDRFRSRAARAPDARRFRLAPGRAADFVAARGMLARRGAPPKQRVREAVSMLKRFLLAGAALARGDAAPRRPRT